MSNITDFVIRAGHSAPLDFQLLTDTDDDGIPDTGINLSTVHHIELVLVNSDTGGTTVYSSLDGTVKATILPGSGGSVRFTPDGTADLNVALTQNGAANIYNGWFWVYNTATQKYSCPEDFDFTIRVKGT